MERLLKYLDEKKDAVNQALGEFLPKADLAPSTLHEAMRYSALGSGKRIRPILVCMCAELFRPGSDEWLPAACALEMAHCYSLIHDDLPAMDNDDLRRGRLTCHKAYNEATAILAGDALLTLAFETVVRRYAPGVAANIIGIMASALGHNGMIGGQMMDLEGEKKKLDPEAIEDMYARKTGMLVAAACRIGAVIGGGEGARLEQASQYGKNLGLLFQITDDILDCTATSDQMGKTVGKDSAAGKSTLVAACGLEAAQAKADELAVLTKSQLKGFDAEALMPRLLVDFILTRKK